MQIKLPEDSSKRGRTKSRGPMKVPEGKVKLTGQIRRIYWDCVEQQYSKLYGMDPVDELMIVKVFEDGFPSLKRQRKISQRYERGLMGKMSQKVGRMRVWGKRLGLVILYSLFGVLGGVLFWSLWMQFGR